MAIELEELFESRSVSVSSKGFTETRNYHVKGEADPTEVAIQLKPDLGSAHPQLPNTILTGIKIEPEEAVEVLAVEYTYEDRTSSDDGDSAGRNENGESWVFELTSQSQNINSVELDHIPDRTDGLEKDTVSSQVMYYIDEFGGVQLGVDADMLQIGYDNGSAVGVDAYRNFASVRVNKVYDLAEVNKAFRTNIYDLQGTVNTAAWCDWEVQEVLFLGASINYDYTAQTASVDYSFLCGKKRTVKFMIWDNANQTTKALTLANVYPFDYVWMRYPKLQYKEETKGDPSSVLTFVRYPTHVYHTTLYRTSDFSKLSLVGPD